MRLIRRRGGSSERGFSLIELLVVIGIIGIMAAVALPAISQYIRTFKIRGASQQVASELAGARAKAIARNTNFGVLFVALAPGTPGNPTAQVGYMFVYEDPVNGKFPDDTSARKTTAQLLALPEQLGPMHTLPDGLQFSSLAGKANNDRGMRFTRLGQMCDPGNQPNPNGEPCPVLDAGTNYVYIDPATRQATVTIAQINGPLKTDINVAPGGRVSVEQGWKQ